MTTEVDPSTRSARIDDLDRRLLGLFAAEPKIGVLEASRRLAIARGTVQARLDRLERSGVITGWSPSLSPHALGFRVTAFVTCEISQHPGRDQVADHLREIPEVLEVWTITGPGDLWCRIVAHSNDDLQRVIDEVVSDPGILRTTTLIGLAEQIPFRTEPLVRAERR